MTKDRHQKQTAKSTKPSNPQGETGILGLYGTYTQSAPKTKPGQQNIANAYTGAPVQMELFN